MVTLFRVIVLVVERDGWGGVEVATTTWVLAGEGLVKLLLLSPIRAISKPLLTLTFPNSLVNSSSSFCHKDIILIS